MIAVHKDFNNIPEVLRDHKIDELINRSLELGEITNREVRYLSIIKPKVLEKLLEIYHNKCAYCESILNQSYTDYILTHYRPKRSYYWLIFEWSNLLHMCPKCHSAKISFLLAMKIRE